MIVTFDPSLSLFCFLKQNTKALVTELQPTRKLSRLVGREGGGAEKAKGLALVWDYKN